MFAAPALAKRLSGDRPFQFQNRGQLFISMHNVTFAIAMRVSHPDCAPFTIQRRDAAPTPTGFPEIVSDGFPILHRDASCLFCTPYGNANFPASRRRFRLKMNCHVGEGFPKVCDNKCLVDRFDRRLDRSDHRLSEIRSALGCINRLAGCFAAFRSNAGTVPNSHSHSRAYIKRNTRSYPDSEPDTITKPSTYASASPTFTPPPIAITSSAGDSRLRCGGQRDRNGRAQGRFPEAVNLHFLSSPERLFLGNMAE
jgi:hypothetical protein